MPIQTDFKFNQKHSGAPAVPEITATAISQDDFLGLLRELCGDTPEGNAQRTWKGKGFNMIWRPNKPDVTPGFGDQPHFLQLNMTDETLSFTDISGPTGIANRGLLQKDIFLGGVAYLQTINDSFDNTGQHFEPGVFNNVPETENPGVGPTVVRMGSIPHGTTINMQGQSFTAPQPRIDPSSIVPFRIGSVDDGETDLVPFAEQDLATPTASRTDLARVAGLDQAHLNDPNLFLKDVLAGQTITETIVLVLSSDSTLPGSVPDIGGGAANIAFLVGKGTPPAGGPNANMPRASAIFWIEKGADKDGKPLLQLQYTQRVILDFNGLSWPHVTVATLRPIDPTTGTA
ncbi:UNVERIFIED_ORG: hypothetical protein GGD51_005133 [Rhizobium esperanzae]|uniref:heme-binding protein n=1 Tax=Rhizobium etli TaxID=29449 RepID=UPI000383A473|nr:heme-binding protein [Rhizobium etli]AGS25813.1 hypothetical protein REMIM1_PF00143 [Rhizobium etli bv. mimosae str. Mim1]